MKKIPTLFQRDPEDRRYVTDNITPGCEWVFTDDGVRATRKYDGTCVMFDGTDWWARREVKPGKDAPNGWVEVDHDDVTGKRVGWEPMAQSPFAKFHAEALDRPYPLLTGTYELVGPKINGNPERATGHMLIPHGQSVLNPAPANPEGARGAVLHLRAEGIEGIVWHHPDGRMAKLKGRDYPKEA